MAIPAMVIVAWKASSVYIFWIGVHYVSANVYPYFCADATIMGLLTSPILVMTPHCRALLWAQQTSSLVIQNMWIIIGTWLCSEILSTKQIM
mgnify:CR=1 FL=1